MKVIGYGDNCVDRYVNKKIMFPGGNCINFAVYASQLGMNSSYLGAFGEDAEAEFIKSALAMKGVDYSKCETEKGSVTERCDVAISDSGNRVFQGDDSRENLHGIYELDAEAVEYLSGFDLIHCSCYSGEEEELPKLSEMPGIVTFDFSEDDEFRTDEYLDEVCKYIDLALFSCEGMSDVEIEELKNKVSLRGVKYVLCTMGPDGQRFFAGGGIYEGKAKLIDAKDTMGAGDSFFTAFLVGLLKSGWTKNSIPEEAAILKALSEAAEFAANNCLVDGAFGCGKEF